MKTVGILLGVIFGAVLLGVLAAGGYVSVKFVVDLFARLDPQTAVLTAIASVTTLLCATLIYRGLVSIGQREARSHARLEKVNLYERMLLLWGTKLTSRTQGDPAVDDELHQLAHLLPLRGSPEVIKAYLALHTLEKTAGLLSPDIPVLFVSVQMAIREDLGLSTQNLKAEDFLPLFFAEVPVAPDLHKAPPRQDITPRVSIAANV